MKLPLGMTVSEVQGTLAIGFVAGPKDTIKPCWFTTAGVNRSEPPQIARRRTQAVILPDF